MKFDEAETFAEKFASPLGQAAQKFGQDKLKIARDVIVRNLHSLGYSNCQIAVAGSNDNTVFHSVSVNAGKFGFNVPVKIQAGQVQAPKYLICNGSLASFDSVGLSKLLSENASDNRATATASPLFGLKPSDVLNSLRAAMADNNLEKAEDALNVLANSGDEKAYATAFEIFRNGLSKTASSQEESKCSRMLKSANSQYLMCGHTNLPVHKVYQDDHGNCRPLYRKGMDETYEAASFMHSKIFG